MTYEAEVLADSPLIYWRLGEPSGTLAVDDSGNAHNGTYFGSPTLGVPGLLSSDSNTAILLDNNDTNTNGARSTASISGGPYSAFTLEATVRFADLRESYGYNFIAGLTGLGLGRLEITLENVGVNDNELRLNWLGIGGNHNLISGTPADIGVDYYIVATYDGTDAKLYINGALVATDSAHPGETVTYAGTVYFSTGDDFFGNDGVNGTLDEIAFYSTALSGARVTAHYNAATADYAVLSLLDASIQILGISGATPTPPGPTPIGQYTRWRVVVRGIDGTYITEYPTAIVQSITWNPPNQPDEAVVLVPIDELNTNAMRQDLSPHREVEIWRNDKLIFTGPAWLIRGDSTSRTLTVTLRDPTSYLQHRYIGKANRTNLLTDGSFEGNGIDWHEFDPNNSMTVSYDTGTVYNGAKSLKLVGTNVNEARFMRQTLTVTAGPLGMPLALSGYCYIDQWLRPGAYGGGMLLERVGIVGPTAYSVAEVVSSTPRKRWVRLETSVRMHPNNTETIRVWVFAIGGTIFWDDIRLTSGESLSFVNEEQGQVVRAIVDYLQGKGRFQDLSPEKSDLNITTVMPTTGVRVTHRQYFLSDHQKGYDGTGPGATGVLDEYLNKSGGIDWRFEPPGRILRGYYPHVGTVRSNVTFTWRYFADEPARNSSWGIIGWNYGSSMEQAANQIVEVGSIGGQNYTGDPSREEGGFSDPSTLGGLTLELVEQAPVDANQNQLREIALNRGDQLKNAIATPQIIVQEVRDPITNEVVYPMIGSLLPGDHIFLDVFDGSFTMDGEYRVAQVVLDAQAETLTITPNPVAV